MRSSSDQNKLIEWLNTLIVLAQWDKNLPLYFARLFDKPDQYQKALQLIRKAPQEGLPPAAPGDALNSEEWLRLYRVTTRAEALRRLFANDRDPFHEADPDEIATLADVSDLTTDAQTMFYSRNGTFHLVLSAIRQRPELNTVELITDGLNRFYTLLDTNETVAEQLYKLACSNDWYPVLASLYDGRDYTADEGETAKASLQDWNRNLNTELRSILLRPTRLYRVPKKLIKLAWEKRNLFTEALNSIPVDKRLTGFELRQQVSNVAYSIFAGAAPAVFEEIEGDLQLLAVVARHYISVRKFAKLDGLVYAWPKIASLAMSNYANLEYIEDFFVEKKPRPTVEELDARDARELYGLCENNGAVIRFLRLRPYFKEIDEDELRRYRPLAPVTISDPVQQPAPTIISPPAANISVTPATPTVVTPARVCELVIKTISARTTDYSAELEYEIALVVSGNEVAKGRTTFSIRNLLDRMLNAIGVTSEESLQLIMNGLFSAPDAEKILVRGGAQLLSTVIAQTGLEKKLADAFRGEGPVRLVIALDWEVLQYLPWEWLPRPGYAELLLSNARFSLVRSKSPREGAWIVSLIPPIRVLGVFPNSPVGTRDISESSIKAMEILTTEGAQYKALVREDATVIRLTDELELLYPHIVHFEGYVNFTAERSPSMTVLLSSMSTSSVTSTESMNLPQFAELLAKNKVQLFVAGRNESSRIFGNAGAVVSCRLAPHFVPALLAPIRAVDDATATSLTTEFYRAFLAGHSLEQALYTARRKVASRGGDWTAFALFADPEVLDFFQPLPPTA